MDLDAQLSALAPQLSQAERQRLLQYLRLLVEWSNVHNLIATAPDSQHLTHHLMDALSLVPLLHDSKHLADVGSGGGLPGFPLAIVNPQMRVTLIEPRVKRAAFLRAVRQEMMLANVHIEQARAEDVKPSPLFDTVVCRAFGSLAEFWRLSHHLCAHTGRLMAMKGRLRAEEVKEVAGLAVKTTAVPLHVPGLMQTRHAVLLQHM